MNNERMKIIEDILKKERKEGYQQGIAEGYAVAERIMVWWLSNHQLVQPRSQEKLEGWSRDELAKLKAKLS